MFRAITLFRGVLRTGVLWFGLLTANALPAGEHSESLRVLFLGDNGHHRPADRFKQFQPALAQRGIELVYTDLVRDLNPGRLAGFDCVMIFANHTRILPGE